MNRVLWWLVLLANVVSLLMLVALAFGARQSYDDTVDVTLVSLFTVAAGPVTCLLYLAVYRLQTRGGLVASYLERKTLEQKQRSAEVRRQMERNEH